jgi:NAD(P)-dependent dehydrogenase (short-subunit alcohol dehydrogenase family)
MRLKDKVAIVTGGAAGIGEALCLGLAREGARVAVADLEIEAAGRVAGQIEAEGGRAAAIEVDVTSRGSCDRMVARTVDALGRLDVLVANAGIYHSYPLLDYPEAEWDRIFAVNVKGVLFSVQAAGIRMRDQGQGGAIVVTSSGSAEGASPAFAGYDSSKGAIRMFVRSAAIDLAPYGIRINAFGPGSLDNAWRGAVWNQSALERELDKIPLGRLGTREDLVGTVLFLASDDSAYITGQTIYVDGGATGKW